MLVGFLFYAQNDTSTIVDRPDASQIHETFILWQVQEKKNRLAHKFTVDVLGFTAKALRLAPRPPAVHGLLF